MDNCNFSEQDIQHLIITYLEGEASDREILLLQEWLGESEANFTFFIQLRKDWLKAGHNQRFSSEKAWQKLNHRLILQQSKKRIARWTQWSSYAAVIILLVSVGYYWTYSPQPEITIAEENIEPGTTKAILVLGSNEEVVLSDNVEDSLPLVNSAVKKEGNTLVYTENNQTVTQENNRLITPRGGEYSLILSDGSRVWLNAESELRYPVQFSGPERKVYLKGEAYFEVIKQEGVPFIVCSDEAKITVLGTEFNVRNYEGGDIATTLVKGSVLVSRAQNVCRLNPGQQAVIGKEGIKINEVDPVLYTSWKDGFFIYRSRTLDDILQELSRWYDFTYFYRNSSLEKTTFTAKLRKFDRVEQVFEVLKGTGKFDFIIKGKTVTVVAK